MVLYRFEFYDAGVTKFVTNYVLKYWWSAKSFYKVAAYSTTCMSNPHITRRVCPVQFMCYYLRIDFIPDFPKSFSTISHISIGSLPNIDVGDTIQPSYWCESEEQYLVLAQASHCGTLRTRPEISDKGKRWTSPGCTKLAQNFHIKRIPEQFIL